MAGWNWTQALVWIVTRDIAAVEVYKDASALALAMDESWQGPVKTPAGVVEWGYQVEPFADATEIFIAQHISSAVEDLTATLRMEGRKLVASAYDLDDLRPKLKPIPADDWLDLRVRNSELEDYSHGTDHVLVNDGGIERYRHVSFRAEDIQRIWHGEASRASPPDQIMQLKRQEPGLKKQEVKDRLFPSMDGNEFLRQWAVAAKQAPWISKSGPKPRPKQEN